MWQPYLDVIRQKCSPALHVLDRFHVVAKMNKTLDDARAAESCKMAQDDYPSVLKKTGVCSSAKRISPRRSSVCGICSTTTFTPSVPICSEKISAVLGPAWDRKPRKARLRCRCRFHTSAGVIHPHFPLRRRWSTMPSNRKQPLAPACNPVSLLLHAHSSL
jgi:hypothetical protein